MGRSTPLHMYVLRICMQRISILLKKCNEHDFALSQAICSKLAGEVSLLSDANSKAMPVTGCFNLQTTSLAWPSAAPVFVAFSSFPPVVLAATADLKDCSKSSIISSICSVPTEIRIRS
jgi:hypothetical protein